MMSAMRGGGHHGSYARTGVDDAKGERPVFCRKPFGDSLCRARKSAAFSETQEKARDPQPEDSTHQAVQTGGGGPK